MGYAYIDDHYDVAKYQYTPVQFREKFIYQAILSAFCSEVQLLEDSFFQMFNFRNLTYAVGVQLDNLGDVINTPRQVSETDDDYRTRLRATIATRRSDGTGDKVLNTMMNLYNSSGGNIYEHNSLMTGGIVVRVNQPQENYKSYVQVMKDMSPACIGSCAILRDTTQGGVAWTPVEIVGANASLVAKQTNGQELDIEDSATPPNTFVVDISETGLEASLAGTLADAGLSRGHLRVESHNDKGNLLVTKQTTTGNFSVETESLTGGDYGYFAEVSQIRMGMTVVEGEQ